jgi:hypothetical protein
VLLWVILLTGKLPLLVLYLTGTKTIYNKKVQKALNFIIIPWSYNMTNKTLTRPLKIPCIYVLLYVHKLWSYNKTTQCGGKFQQDKMFGNVDCLNRSIQFPDLLPHTETYTSHKSSSHKPVLIHVLFKFSMCSKINKAANQFYTGTMPYSLN